MGDGISRRALLSMATASAAGFAGVLSGCSHGRGAARPKVAAQPRTVWVSGSSTIGIDAATGAKRWSRPFGAGGPPIVVDGVCYLFNADGIYAVDAVSGAIRWRQPIRSNTEGAPDPMFGSGLVFTVAVESKTEATVYALDRGTGKIRWKGGIDFQFEYVQCTNGWLAVSASDTDDSRFAVLSAQSGETRYQQSGLFLTLANHASTSPDGTSLLDGRFIVSRAPSPTDYSTNDVTYCFDPRTQKFVTYPSSSEVYAASKTTLFTGVNSDQALQESLQAVNIETGELLWSKPQPGYEITGVKFSGEIVLTVTDTGATGMSLDTGDALWSRHQWNEGVDKEVYSHEIYGGVLLIGAAPEDDSVVGGTVSALDCRTGVIKWSSSLVDKPLRMVAAGDSVFVVSGGNTVYALDARTGQHKWIFSMDDMGTPSIAVG